ncbi:MAG: carboxyl transferase domain-containing protein [Corynebacterium sp.]|uniref:acetyl-CoA carboxylase family protein n=1 Tax=Corynebacterium sp. TaxID=1720 RepID=UPI003F064D31
MTSTDTDDETGVTVLVANRGEIALRIIRTARELGLHTLAVYAQDDAAAPHVTAADDAVALDGAGPRAYLDRDAIVAAGVAHGGDRVLVHPGYGFLSEDPEFARACDRAGLTLVGPAAEVLDNCGDKSAARRLAESASVPVLPATSGPSSLDEVLTFTEGRDGVMIKALAGGGGRGMRELRADGGAIDPDAVAAAYSACAAEAEAGFGDSSVFAEELLLDARHIEVQILGGTDRSGATVVRALGDRDCSVQRRHQKLLEIAPAPLLDDAVRRTVHEAAVRLGAAVDYRSAGTVEFLVSGDRAVFLEMNPRLQVEHTVTEETTGTDLVALQLLIALGTATDDLDLPDGVTATGARDTAVSGSPAAATGTAIQARVNMETMSTDGSTTPSSGTLRLFAPPAGPGIRVDTFGRTGLTPSPRYDSLLAKVIAHTRTGGLDTAARKTADALAEFTVDGVATNAAFLRAVLDDEEFRAGAVPTSYLARRLPDLVETAAAYPSATAPAPEDTTLRSAAVPDLEPGEITLDAPMTGVVVQAVDDGTAVTADAEVILLEAMKMHHGVTAGQDVTVSRILVSAGDTVVAGDPVAVLRPGTSGADTAAAEAVDLDATRDDLTLIRDRHAGVLDEARPEAMTKRHGRGRRSARENIEDLVDEGSFVEYGALAVAAQASRRSEEDLIANTPADGMVTGVATIDGRETAVLSYDYTVLAGTQGMRNHAKTDRIIDVATRRGIPLVLFAEGGGGRPGDTDVVGVGLDVGTFRSLASLNGKVPLVAVVSGRCFAGNAALAGVCDTIIATPDANIGMGGPAMIEGGGLGAHRPEDIGPVEIQRHNGVIHLPADDEAHAVALARQYLSYFGASGTGDWEAPDPRLARHVVPENRLRAYDMRAAIDAVADVGSVLELRPDYATGAVTALIRVEGQPYGVVANAAGSLGGAIDAVASDKFTDFLTLCEAHRLPVVSFCDTPGFMVGPESEKEATVRRFGRMFVAGAKLTVPTGTVILRKAYGLGAMAMAAGSFRASQFTVAWPTGEIGAMGLEGAVRLGYRKELAAVDGADRDALFDSLLADAYAKGRAVNAAMTFELDDVIDPADTRAWIRTLVP